MCKNFSSEPTLLALENVNPEPGSVLANLQQILLASRASDDGERCMIAPHPDLRETLKSELVRIRAGKNLHATSTLQHVELPSPGFNDGLIIPPDEFPLGTPLSVIKSSAADRAPLRGAVRVIVVLVDFSDRAMAATNAHFEDLFFGIGGANPSVREYFRDVTQNLVDIQGEVVGPFRLPRTIVEYANGDSGTGGATPNAQTMARDALAAANPTVNFAPYDNDGNGFVDAFVVIHAGSGAEQTGSVNDIWSHKWTIQGGAQTVDGTRVFGYLTVPEDSEIGVCCHELGHLLFGFPDLYDTDSSSEGIGNWCLMAGGSWGGLPAGSRPVHPSAWCKANQGWSAVDVRTSNGTLNISDVKAASSTVYRLWKDGGPGQEYFLLENRQQTGFDASMPGQGLLIWHIDEAITSNRDENHPKVALVQADNRRDMENNVNRGDAGDPYPGSTNNIAFNDTSSPNSKSYAGVSTCVAVTAISAPGPVMTANVQVRCVTKVFENKRLKDFIDNKGSRKDFEKRPDKPSIEKPIIDKHKDFDKPFSDKNPKELVEKPNEKLLDFPGGGGFGSDGLSADAPKPTLEKGKDFDKRFKEFKEFKEQKEHKEKDKDKEMKEKDFKEHKELKEFKEKDFKEFKEFKEVKEIKEHKEFEKDSEGKLTEGGFTGTGELEARIAYLEQLIAATMGGGEAAQPFIGSDLRPDLTGGAFTGEADQVGIDQMKSGNAGAKRQYDTKPQEG